MFIYTIKDIIGLVLVGGVILFWALVFVMIKFNSWKAKRRREK